MKRKIRKLRWYFIRWLILWIKLVDLILGIITFGSCGGVWSLYADSWFLNITDEDFDEFGDYA